MSFATLHSWNVNGLRSVSGKGFAEYLEKFSPDVLCLQETKIGSALADSLEVVAAYPHRFWHAAAKAGYSGTVVLAKKAPLRVLYDIEGDTTLEGRVISAEFEGVWVVCAYVPNSQRELLRLDHRLAWDAAFRAHLVRLAESKPVLVCGDFNCAHTEIDLANPKQNKRNAGFTDEERGSFSTLLGAGFEDTFRVRNPGVIGAYSWWTYRMNARERNIGWRLDYWLADSRLSGRWDTPAIHPEVTGSDHCPVSVRIDAALLGGVRF